MENVNVAFMDLCGGILTGTDQAEEIAALQTMLAGNDELVNSTAQEGCTALGIACWERRLHIVRFLLENGADVNRLDEHGYTPLNTTLTSRPTHNDQDNDNNMQRQIIRLLLEYNADPNMAVTIQNEGVPRKLTPMHFVVLLGDLHIVQMLLRAGATDTQGMHCLHQACKQKSPALVEKLLNFPNLAVGAENLPQNSFRNRAFCAAAFFLHEDNVSAAFDIFNIMRSQGLSLDGNFITPFLPTTTLLHQCLKLPSNDSRAEAVHQALEMGVDPTYPIPVDQGTGHISPFAYALREPEMDLSGIFLLYRACSGLGQLDFEDPFQQS